MKKLSFVICVLLILAMPLWAQIKVDKSAGTKTSGAATKLVLQTEEESVPIYLVTGESSMMASGTGAYGNSVTVSGSGVSTRLLCEAPAELTLDGGVYQFQLTEAVSFNGKFKVSATGGTQVWEVNRRWGKAAAPLIMSGIVSVILGPVLLIVGVAFDAPSFIKIEGGIMTAYGLFGTLAGTANRPTAELMEVR